MQINERIKFLRQHLNLSQAKFASETSLSSGYIASIELGTRKVNDRIVRLICSTYAINEMWLKTGQEPMSAQNNEPKLERALVLFKKLTPEFQDYLLLQIDSLLLLQNNCLAWQQNAAQNQALAADEVNAEVSAEVDRLLSSVELLESQSLQAIESEVSSKKFG